MRNPPTHFFKFIPPGFKFNLSIPSSFLTNLNLGSCSNVKLRRGCDEWSVGIDDGVFGDGWRSFVRENGVQEFDFIVFKHQGNMVFDFFVFDQSTCQRQYPTLLDKMDVEESLTESEPIRTDKWLKKLRKRKRKEDAASQEQEEFQVKKGRDSTMKKNCNSTSMCHRYFISNLTPSNFKKATLHLPINFSAPNGLKMGEMILRDDKGRSWEVQLNKREEKFLYLGRGIKPFLVANGFKEGDAFKFELVGRKKDKRPIANFSCIHGLISFEEDDRQYSRGELKSYNIQQSDLDVGTLKGTIGTIMHPEEGNFQTKEIGSAAKETRLTLNGHPYFMSSLKPSSFKKSFLHLPCHFTKRSRLKTGEVILRDDKDRSWKVQLNKNVEKFYQLGCGLRAFLVANEMKVGDAFKFELIEKEKNKPPIFKFSCLTPTEEDGRQYFMGKLKSYNIQQSVMYLPQEFARWNGLTDKKKMILKKAEKQRLWKVELRSYKGRYYIGQGWKEFCIANGLKEGDRFKVEVVDKGEVPILNFYLQRNIFEAS